MANYLSPMSGRQFIDANGNPYSGAKLFTYESGTTTKVTTYKDSAGAASHANPIVLNSRGEPADGSGVTYPIWQTGGTNVKYVLAPSGDTDPPASPYWTEDNIPGINDDTSASATAEWVAGPDPTYVSATSFTLVGDQTSTFHVGRRVKTSNSGGTIYSTITASAYTTLTTVTVVNDSGSLDSGLSSVFYGLISSTNGSVPSVKTGGLAWEHKGSVWFAEGADVLSAADCNIWTTDGNTVHVTGTTTISDWGTAPQAGATKMVVFDGALQLTYDATTNKLNTNGTNYTTEAGDRAIVYADSTTSYIVTILPLDGRPLVGDLVSGTVTATTSGTAHDYTSIPSWVKRITISLSGVSTNGTSVPIIQIGDSGGVEATNYLGTTLTDASTGESGTNYSSGFMLTGTHAAADVFYGIATLVLVDAATNTWAFSFVGGKSNAAHVLHGGGSKALSATLDRVRLTTANGTDAFDAGSVNILYE